MQRTMALVGELGNTQRKNVKKKTNEINALKVNKEREHFCFKSLIYEHITSCGPISFLFKTEQIINWELGMSTGHEAPCNKNKTMEGQTSFTRSMTNC